MNNTLTPAEKEIVRRLKRKAPHVGCFGEMMQMVFSGNEPTEVRQMLADIKCQSFHAPEATAKIIGLKTFLMIIKL
ncbi:MAG: hypothetical protein ACTHMM_18530 [Agriterribacter sp.]